MIKTMFKAKKLLALVMAAFVLTAFALTSCSSDGGSGSDSDTNGKTLLVSYGGQTGSHFRLFKFYEDGSFEQLSDGSIAYQGTYTGNPAQDGSGSLSISSGETESFTVSGQTLTIGTKNYTRQ